MKRTEEALAAWREIATGKQRNAANLARLAEVFAQFGYIHEALPEIAAACELDPNSFALQMKAAELQSRGEEYEAALASLAKAEKLAENDEERKGVLGQQIKVYQLNGTLAMVADALEQEIAAGQPTARRWYLLANYREALREFPEATRAIDAALALAGNDLPALTAAARIAEQSGSLLRAAELNRTLAAVDRRGRTQYLQHVAQLEMQLGRVDEALAAGRELIAAAPGNVETHQFFADLCFRLGKSEEGLSALAPRGARQSERCPSGDGPRRGVGRSVSYGRSHRAVLAGL